MDLAVAAALSNQMVGLREPLKVLSVESSHSHSRSLVQATERKEQAAADAELVKSAAARAIRYNRMRISSVYLSPLF